MSQKLNKLNKLKVAKKLDEGLSKRATEDFLKETRGATKSPISFDEDFVPYIEDSYFRFQKVGQTLYMAGGRFAQAI